jgi:queuosine precursor transporter
MSNATSNIQREFQFFVPVAGMFVAVLLIANTTGTKLFQLGPLIFPGGIILFPISYIFGDILTEVYGYGRTRQVIWTGFAANVLMSLTYMAVIALPSAPFWPHQEAIATILGQVPRIVVGSIIGYWAGEFLEAVS